MPTARIDSKRFFAVACALCAVLTLLLLGSAGGPAPAGEPLAFFQAHRGRFLLLASLVLVWTIVSVVNVVVLGRLLESSRPTLSFAGTLLSAGGILLLGFGTFAFVGALFSIAAASSATGNFAQGNFEAAVWSNLSFMLTDPGLMTLGAGQAIAGWLAWTERRLPKLVAAVAVVGGIAGLLTLAVYQTPVLAAVQLVAFAITAGATAFAVLKRVPPDEPALAR